MPGTPHLLISVVGLLGLIAPSCGSDGSDSTSTSPAIAGAVAGDVVVFAASSLTEAFTEMGDAFTAENPGAKLTFNFAGSGDLVAQIIEGAPADVLVSADDTNMAKLIDAGGNAGEPVVIAKNTFEIIVEAGNPKGITGVTDLVDPDLTVVLCADTVPCGKGAAKILANAAVTVTPKSFEEKVKGVVTKVTAGEADAGIVFVTDVQAAGDDATGVEIPADINVISNYPIVVIKQASNPGAAQAFIDFVASDAGQAILGDHGFLAP